MALRFFVLLLLLFCPSLRCFAIRVQVTVTDPQQKALPDALVILQELGPPERDILRALTNQAGAVTPQDFAPGLYRAIVIFPYSRWQTGVREFIVNRSPVTVALKMQETQSLDMLPVSVGQMTVRVLDANGHPATGARVLIRDEQAHASSEHWGTTDAQGATTLELSGEPSRLIVVYQDKLYSFPADGFDTERTLRLEKPLAS